MNRALSTEICGCAVTSHKSQVILIAWLTGYESEKFMHERGKTETSDANVMRLNYIKRYSLLINGSVLHDYGLMTVAKGSGLSNQNVARGELVIPGLVSLQSFW
jgi:hypothetical protein